MQLPVFLTLLDTRCCGSTLVNTQHLVLVVRGIGLEPTRLLRRQDLNLVRLPISPPPRGIRIVPVFGKVCTTTPCLYGVIPPIRCLRFH